MFLKLLHKTNISYRIRENPESRDAIFFRTVGFRLCCFSIHERCFIVAMSDSDWSNHGLHSTLCEMFETQWNEGTFGLARSQVNQWWIQHGLPGSWFVFTVNFYLLSFIEFSRRSHISVFAKTSMFDVLASHFADCLIKLLTGNFTGLNEALYFFP